MNHKSIIALTFPGGQSIGNPVASQGLTDIGSLLSQLLQVAIFLAGFLAFIWFVWGALQYLFAGGNKENLGKARARMTWAIVGLVMTLLAYLVAQFAGQILQPKPGQVPLPGFSLVPIAYAQSANPSPIDISQEFGFGQVKDLGQGLGLLVGAGFFNRQRGSSDIFSSWSF